MMIPALIFSGAHGQSPQERLMADAARASLNDLIALLRRHKIAPIVISAPHTADLLIAPAPKLILSDDPVDRPFHFGTRAADLIDHLRDESLRAEGDQAALLIVGAASVPLWDDSVLNRLTDWIAQSDGRQPDSVVLTNNLHSSDWLLIRTDRAIAAALPVIRQVDRDNGLAWLLEAEWGTGSIEVLKGLRPIYGFDLDTPTDLALLAAYPGTPPILRAELDRMADKLKSIRLSTAIEAIRREGSTIALIGRTSPTAWQAFNQVAHCWTRVIAEERGMVASGRIEAGLVRSVLIPWLKARGTVGFFEDLAGMADAVLFDSRVLFAALGLNFTAADRYASDLLWPDAIQDSWLCEFTEAAANCPIPIILGGHTVVAGGLYAIAELIAPTAIRG